MTSRRYFDYSLEKVNELLGLAHTFIIHYSFTYLPKAIPLFNRREGYKLNRQVL